MNIFTAYLQRFSFSRKAFFLSLLAHIFVIVFVVVTFPVPKKSFQPAVSFWGSFVYEQNIFGNEPHVNNDKKSSGHSDGLIIKTSNVKRELKSFELNKPGSVNDVMSRKKNYNKTSFSTVEPTSERVPDVKEEVYGNNDYQYRPLRFEKK